LPSLIQQGERPTAREVFRRLHDSCAAHIEGFESVGGALALPDTSSDGCRCATFLEAANMLLYRS